MISVSHIFLNMVFEPSFKNASVPEAKENFVLSTGSRPQQSKKSLIRVAVAEELTTSQWGMKIIDSSEKNMELSVMSPVDAIVGGYTLFVETKTKVEGSNKKLNFRMEYPDPVYMLFNAWCKGTMCTCVNCYIYNQASWNFFVISARTV